MTPSPVLRRSRIGARIVPFIVALGALPLMAPTCGSPGEGFKTFSRQSLIIPMDVCYQSQNDSAGTPTPVACPQTADPGSVIKAYGLVYQLIRAGVPVYWIIRQDKASLTDVDLTIQYAGGVPAYLYDWATGNPPVPTSPTPVASHAIDYRGGPFVVDGSDFDQATQVLQQFKGSGGTTLAPAPFQNVNIHVANVSFRGYAKRTMAGGWSAGGPLPPKLALLDIGSTLGSNSKNSEFVIQGYLAQAGLDTPSAGGTSDPGAHGQIYDRLFMPDFIPTVPGADWKRTRLFANGYQILWIPHWAAPGSCATCAAGSSCSQTACTSSHYDPVTISSALKTIGQFVASGKDLFAECAGMGSLEGVVTGTPPNPTGTDAAYGTAVVETHLQTSPPPSPSGVFIETNTPGAAVFRGPFTSPLLQIGDFRFTPASGAISDWKATRYTPAVDPGGADSTVRMIQETPGGDTAWDLFTIRPGFGGKGTVVYLGGHSYSGNDGGFSTSGTRLVLNTLFNLGAGCVASGLACNTGLFGICSQGVWACDSSGQPFCQQTVFPRPETCNGLDDDCNGAVDEGLVVNCYDTTGFVDPLGRTGDPLMATSVVGECHAGVSSCGRKPDGSFGMSACVGQVLPTAESCNGLDDDCNGAVDDALARSCYDGPAYSLDTNGNPKGICKVGAQVCQSGAWGGPAGAGFVPGACPGEVLPQPEVCPADPSTVTTALDVNCDGAIISCTCTAGQSRACFSGPGTPGVGVCRAGTQTCDVNGNWGECNGEVVANLFAPEPCTTPAKPAADPGYKAALDTNCDGFTKQCEECVSGTSESCYGTWGTTDPSPVPTVAGRGQCAWGTRTCVQGAWGACAGFGLASTIEYCDAKDNNCNGPRVASPDGRVGAAGALTGAGSPPGVDDNATCPAHSKCLNGVCVADTCGVEVPPPEGYVCTSGQVQQGTCGTSSCGTGEICRFGTCDNPCPVGFDPSSGTTVSLVCATGTVCGGGACIAGGCHETGCPAGELCQDGACVPDACLGRTCPTGTFCRQGDCVQSCTFVTCAAGQKCGIDGFCEPDACAGKTCGAGQRCDPATGQCAANPCGSLACATGQLCQNQNGVATCVDDPCGTKAQPAIRCPAGVCIEGQCFAAASPGAGTGTTTSSSGGGCGCGAGGAGTGLALPALLFVLALPLARRRRGAAGGGGALLVALLSLSLLASACADKKTEKTFDPALCTQTTCNEQRCVDLSNDPTHCGACGTICSAGQQCSSGFCGPTNLVAPYVGSLSPSTGYKDNDAFVVTILGERFQAGATVRMATPLGPRTEPCPAAAGTCQWLSAGSIRLVADLTGIGPGTTPFTIRVVNPDNVISNARTLAVDIPRPDIAGVVPSSVVAGTVTPLDVSPTTAADAGFTSGSLCLLKPHGSARPSSPTDGIGLPASLDGHDLACQLDASTIAPGSWDLWVMSEPRASGARLTSSGPAAVTIQASDPVIFSIDPNVANTTNVSISVTGARFDSTCKVLFDGNVIAGTLFVSDTSLFVPAYVVTTTAGNYPVTVRKGAVAPYLFSNAVTFTVGGTPPTVTSFSPSTAYQGDPAVNLVFTGTAFPANSAIEVEPPGGTVFSALPTTFATCGGSCTQVSATKSLIKSPGLSEPEGTWLARVRLGAPGAPTAAPWPLRVLSNQAILRSYSAAPLPAQSGVVGSTKTSLTLQVSNIHGVGADFTGVKVFMQGPVDATAQTTKVISLSPVPTAGATTLTTVPVTLNVPSGLYALTVNNPNATPSNGLTFSVTPGPPTIKNLCVGGTGGKYGPCTPLTSTRQTGTVNVTIEGTNFAALDANGNGSIVMVAADFMPGWPTYDCTGSTGVQVQQVPGTVTVRDSGTMDVAVDTLSAYVDPSLGTNYYVSIWNPSGSGAPLKSGAPNAVCASGTIPATSLPTFKILP